MNERIIELANEANKDIGYTFKMEDANQLHELMEKFAELIIKDCIQVAGPEDSYQDCWFTAKSDSVNNIKTYYGVK